MRWPIHVVRFKGFQVAPAELENVIVSHPAVADVVVIPRPDDRVSARVGERVSDCVIEGASE